MHARDSGDCAEGTAEAGRELDPTEPQGADTAEDEPAASDEQRRGVTHGSPLAATERARLKEQARHGGAEHPGGPAQRDRGD